MSAGAQGRAAEEQARRYLETHGLLTLVRNFRCRQGEIDLIVADGKTTVFVEVRFRSRGDFGSAAETVDARKRARIGLAAQHYLLKTPGAAKRPCRFDVVAINGNNTIDWIKNAFDLS